MAAVRSVRCDDAAHLVKLALWFLAGALGAAGVVSGLLLAPAWLLWLLAGFVLGALAATLALVKLMSGPSSF